MVAIAAPTLPHTAGNSPSRHYSPLELWHLLSLDAPTVAALWTVCFARALHVNLPWIAPTALATGVWVLYALDRLLDAHYKPASQLRERHLFHARHREAFRAGIALALPVVLITAFRFSLPAVHRPMFLLALLVAAYLLAVHGLASVQHLLPKEMAVGLIFATATVIPVWVRTPQHLALFVGGMLFATLCWLNCAAIEHWEGGRAESEHVNHNDPKTTIQRSSTLLRPTQTQLAHVTTGWAGRHLQSTAATLATLSLAVASYGALHLAQMPSGLPLIASAVSISAALLAVLDRQSLHLSPSLSPLALRIAADAALLTPLLLLPFTR